MQFPHNDALVITLRIHKATVKRILEDQGSVAEVMYYSLFKRLGFTSDDLKLAEVPLVGFSGTPIYLLGTISLPV